MPGDTASTGSNMSPEFGKSGMRPSHEVADSMTSRVWMLRQAGLAASRAEDVTLQEEERLAPGANVIMFNAKNYPVGDDGSIERRAA